jgi:hypothetical protein
VHDHECPSSRQICIAGGACEPGFPAWSLCGRVRERYGSRRQRLLDLSRLLGCLRCLGGRQGSPQLLPYVSEPPQGRLQSVALAQTTSCQEHGRAHLTSSNWPCHGEGRKLAGCWAQSRQLAAHSFGCGSGFECEPKEAAQGQSRYAGEKRLGCLTFDTCADTQPSMRLLPAIGEPQHPNATQPILVPFAFLMYTRLTLMALAPPAAYDLRFGTHSGLDQPFTANPWALCCRSALVRDVSSAILAFYVMMNLGSR